MALLLGLHRGQQTAPALQLLTAAISELACTDGAAPKGGTCHWTAARGARRGLPEASNSAQSRDWPCMLIGPMACAGQAWHAGPGAPGFGHAPAGPGCRQGCQLSAGGSLRNAPGSPGPCQGRVMLWLEARMLAGLLQAAHSTRPACPATSLDHRIQALVQKALTGHPMRGRRRS